MAGVACLRATLLAQAYISLNAAGTSDLPAFSKAIGRQVGRNLPPQRILMEVAGNGRDGQRHIDDD
jgi:hypothetical protein